MPDTNQNKKHLIGVRELRKNYADDEDAVSLIDMYLNSDHNITERQLEDTIMALDVASGPETPTSWNK